MYYEAQWLEIIISITIRAMEFENVDEAIFWFGEKKVNVVLHNLIRIAVAVEDVVRKGGYRWLCGMMRCINYY